MSKEFKVLYHGCGACYYDGTLLTISNRELVQDQMSILFGKI